MGDLTWVLFSCTVLNPYIYVILDRLTKIKSNNA